ncbi:thiamine pyrophosphate-dependent enzyme [Sedimenticola selenatireducens]|uniref:3-methyl-2-oxobutanoate dehydrogenase (2-methylpropanoyl-transferring) n=1 Tax=Sedimenticola selenatireducens TaxID=191960 RepID=A0A2N6CTM6_9GAMM|nr:thiamine pyrophosphate-dependent enzyme [Sedimenticola selenatireducens]PLX60521.1 MAG: MFS transporter [Sedimenticola selenatireducens]
MKSRAELMESQFSGAVLRGDLPAPVAALQPSDVGLTPTDLVDLFESQLMSRHLDYQSRRLRARNESFYTIGSAGHEGNAVLGKLFRITDMAFLHYRSGALLIQRSKQRPGETPLYDMLLSFAASREDPISGGRHKVLGSKTLLVPPQTSTIASHLPKAMGAAHALGLARVLEPDGPALPRDSVILCNFGDASANHSTAQGAINAAGWAAYQNSPMPIVFVCEDNGIGISTSTPRGWIHASFCGRAGLHYLYCDGTDLLDTARGVRAAVDYARRFRKPVFLHMRVIRLLGHAGSDTETGYRTLQQVEADERQDPLLHSARILLEQGILGADEICGLNAQIAQRVARIAEHAILRPKLRSAAEVMAPIAPPHRTFPPAPPADSAAREAMLGQERRQLHKPQNMARLINLALADILLQYRNSVVCGEDVGRKGGVYSVTTGLLEKFGPHRVINTLLDEQSILGLAIGLGQLGYLPIPEIQFLAYVHNAEDQIRGEAATLSFFSNGQFSNPMVVRIAGLAYQKGFGGHFHNDNSLTLFRDIPGLVIACPSNGADAVQMLRSCVALAREQRRVVIFIEPIALYMTRDLYQSGDERWTAEYAAPGEGMPIAVGEFGCHGNGTDLCIISYGNGYYLSRQAAHELTQGHGIDLRVIDLRWLAPLDEAALIEMVAPCRRVLVVDECRRTGSISEAVVTLLTERAPGRHRIARVTAEDSFIPLAEAAHLVLPDKQQIIEAARALIDGAPI